MDHDATTSDERLRAGMTNNVESLWRFIPASQRAQYERLSEVIGVSKGGVLAFKLCHEALRDYCPPDEQVKVAAALARTVAERAA